MNAGAPKAQEHSAARRRRTASSSTRASGAHARFTSVSPVALDMLETAGLDSQPPSDRFFSAPEPCNSVPGSNRVAPNAEHGTRKILVDDAELLRRVEGVKVTTDLDNALANVSLQGWKWKRDKHNFSLFTKGLATTGGEVADAQVLAMGTIQSSRALERLASMLRSPNESDYNALMKSLYKREFIYGSLVHVLPSTSDSCVQDPSDSDGSQLTVKTSAFVRSSRFSHKKNEQMCYMEHFRPTKDGFALVFASLPQHELVAGKASSRHVDQLCPMRGWLLVEQTPGSKTGVRVLFHSSLDPVLADPSSGAQNLGLGLCSVKTTVTRLLRLAQGFCNLGEVLSELSRAARVGRRHPEVGNCPGGGADFSNSHCVACTTKLDFLRRRRRCGLCAYNACSKCSYREPMLIYNRYAATIQFCARCRECMLGGEYPHLRLAPRRHSTPTMEGAPAE